MTLQNGLDLMLEMRYAHTSYLGHNLGHICDVAQGAQDGLPSLYNNKLSLIVHHYTNGESSNQSCVCVFHPNP